MGRALTRVFVASGLDAGARITLEGTAANHVARVLRLRVGDSLCVFDGRGGEYSARIAASGAHTVSVDVLTHSAVERESPVDITLVQGVSRGDRMDWVIQKSTELGVRHIVPVLTERSIVRLEPRQAERKLEHWRAVAVAACEQSGRNLLPELSAAVDLRDFLAQAAPRPATRLQLSPTATLSARELVPSDAELSVLIGPEGGLSEAEEAAALAAGFIAVRFGTRILRTETAALAALAVLQHRFGDL